MNNAVRELDAWLAADDPDPWVVETSGSSGAPKRVVLSREAVLASVRASARRLGGSGRWLLALPASYVAGVQVICRSLVAGHAPVLLEEHASFAEAAAGADYVSLVPTQLHRLLDTDADALRRFRTVLLGGGPVDAALRARAADAGCAWWRRTARRRPRAGASTTATPSTAWRSRSAPTAASGSPAPRSSTGTPAAPT